MNLFYYPPASRSGYSNPYSIHYKKALEQYFNVLDKDNKPANVLSLAFLNNAFKADVFVVNWLESVSFLRFGFLQYLIVLLGLKIIKWRKKKIVWMFHNICPHQGDNKYTRKIQNVLYKQSVLIISHSKQAAEYARIKGCNKVFYRCHPISAILVKPFTENIEPYDVLIWGTVLPYKGIYEFISQRAVKDSGLRIRIIGKCEYNQLCKKITSECTNIITYENRRIDFDELAACIGKSRYVLFPYIGDSVSSSGGLIDTIALGGNPIGPHVGAFKDLEEEDVCLTYKSYDQLLSLLKSHKSISPESRNTFINNNSWNNLAQFISDKIQKQS